MAGAPSFGEEKILYTVEKTYLKLGNITNREELLYGTLLLLEKCDGYYIEWRPSISDEGEKIDGVSDSWAVINSDAVGYTPHNKEIELRDVGELKRASEHTGALYNVSKVNRFHNIISFPMDQLVSCKKIRKTMRHHPYVIFVLICGTTHQPIYFQKGGINNFFQQLAKKVMVIKSSTDDNLFLISEHKTEALETSFDALDLFADQRSALQRFAAAPVRGTFSAFAKVSGLLTDALVATDHRSTMAPEFCDQLRTSIDESEHGAAHGNDVALVNASRPEDPDFLFVDKKVKLPSVEMKPRGKPLSRGIWEQSFTVEGRVADPERIKHMIYRGGISHELRRDVWKFVLSFYPWDSTSMEREDLRKKKVDEYFAMKLQWKTMSESQKSRFVAFNDRESLIEKDVKRTDRTTPFFSGDNNEKLIQLNDILMTYVMYNFDLGYVQGMSDLLSPILLVMDNEVDAFWCFVGFMNLVESNFEMDQEGMKLQLNQLNQIVQVVDRKLYNYLDNHDSSNMYFAFRWLLILFKREFNMTDIMRLWEVLWTGLPCKNYLLIIASTVLVKSHTIIVESGFSFNEILKHINDQSGQIDLPELLMRSEALAEQLLTCDNLPDHISKIIGMEPQQELDREPSPSPSPPKSESPASSGSQATNKPPRPANTPARKLNA